MKSKRPFYIIAIELTKEILKQLCHQKTIKLEVLCDYRGQLTAYFNIINNSEIPISQSAEVAEELRRLNVPEAIALIDKTIESIANEQYSPLGLDTEAYYQTRF